MESKLSGNGVRLALFQYLWAKSTDHKMSRLFKVPDTIIYKLKFPTYWIFTSKKDGYIKTKSEINITKDNILKKFASKPRKNEDVATKIVA